MAWAPDYVEVDDLREFITGSEVEVPVDEANFPRAIAAASRAIDRHCRRQFGQVAVAEVRRYQVRPRRGYWVADIDDLMTTSGLLVADEAVVAPELTPLNAAAKGMPWTELEISNTAAVDDRGRATITASWGWIAVPPAVVEACLLQASRLAARRGAPFGVAGSPQSGTEMRLLAKVDPDVAVTLEAYRRKARPR